MCVPLMIIGIAAMAASGAMTAYGQYETGQAQDKYYRYLATQNELEAEAALKTGEQKTTIAQNEAAQRAKELKGEVATVEGAQRAAMAAMGISGVTTEDILKDTSNKARLDELNIRYSADIQSWLAQKEAKEQAWALKSQAGLFRFSGQQAKTASYINMTSTLLGTASSIAFMGAGGLKVPAKPSGEIVQTGYQNVGGHGFQTAWSPSKLY